MNKIGPRIIFFSAYAVLVAGGIFLNETLGWGAIQRLIANNASRPPQNLGGVERTTIIRLVRAFAWGTS